jgi:hypothetical protein
MIKKKIIQVWKFQSDTSDKTYETLQYEDNSTSCNCMGWTRHVASDGSRTCKHCRLVDMGRADMECISHMDYREIKEMKRDSIIIKIPKLSELEARKKSNTTVKRRSFDFED